MLTPDCGKSVTTPAGSALSLRKSRVVGLPMTGSQGRERNVDGLLQWTHKSLQNKMLKSLNSC